MIARPPQSVRAEVLHGGTRVFSAATLTRTQLVGYRTERDEASRHTIPMREVKAIQVRGVEPHGTATKQGLWTGLIVLAAVGGVIALVLSSVDFGWHINGGILPLGKL